MHARNGTGGVAGWRAAADPMPAEVEWPKTCSCGRRYTREEWESLPLLGRQAGEPDLELRNCWCGSTLAVALTADGDLLA